jgi:AAA family ATP:ADP antiporter
MIIIAWLERLKHTDLHNEELNAEKDYQQTLGSNPLAGFMLFVKNPYLLGIGIFILLYTAISTFVYFELKNLMAGLDESTRTQLWAGMDFAVNILTIGTAMFCTSRLATRFGLAVTPGQGTMALPGRGGKCSLPWWTVKAALRQRASSTLLSTGGGI